MRLEHSIPVFGQHDAQTLSQLRDVASRAAYAALMADGHLGYIMPIGGVAAYPNQVSVAGVGFDIACIAKGTPVTTADGYSLPIEQVLPHHPLALWDGERSRSALAHSGHVLTGQRQTLRLRLSNGRTLELTPDHEVLTANGWLQAQQLTPQDRVACQPFVGLPHEQPTGYFPMPQAGRKLGLPTRANDPRLAAMLRLMGFVLGSAGWDANSQQVCAYAYHADDAKRIQQDFRHLGFVPHLHRERCQKTQKERFAIYIDSVELVETFKQLGIPTNPPPAPIHPMPWLMQLPAWLRAQYLSGFCSATMAPPSLTQRGRLASLWLYAKPSSLFLEALFKSLGFQASVIPSKPFTSGKVSQRIRLLGGQAAQLRFLETVGFCYSLEHRIAAATVAGAVWESGRETHPKASRGAGEICWLSIVSMEAGRETCVYDIATQDPAHCFLAQGMVVHNCGNAAIRTQLQLSDIEADLEKHANEIASSISFGVGRSNKADDAPTDHPLFSTEAWDALPSKPIREALRQKARQQLGTVGSGNHYVDVFADQQGRIWVGVHFGSRGLGHSIATGFMNLAQNRPWEAKGTPTTEALLSLDSPLGQGYWALMNLAGQYAYAGREWVARKVVQLLGGQEQELVHNHHNFAWKEVHHAREWVVVRKGATPAFPGQKSFVGGSMGDEAVILQGQPNPTAQEAQEQAAALFSTIHGAGRVMSRSAAIGKIDRKTGQVLRPGQVTQGAMKKWIKQKGVILRGGGLDESPHVYRRLPQVLQAQGGTIQVLHTLRPLIVVMAGADEFDPYKD